MKVNLSDLERSPFWLFSPNVEQICHPLFEQFGINYFDYARFFPDNTCISFFSDPNYIKYLLKTTEYQCPTGRIPQGKYLWKSYINEGFLEQISKDFNYYHGITYVRTMSEYTELFNFSAPKTQESVLGIYLNYEEILDYFITHFTKYLEDFLKKNKSTRIILPGTFIGDTANADEKLITTTNFIAQLNGNTNTRRMAHHIKVGEQLVSLTTREVQCLSYLMKGYSAKKIASTLDLSTRTVETFCAKIMEKANMPSRLELIGSLDSNTINLLKILTNIKQC